MVSTGIKSSKFPNKHLAKTFYFVLSFLFQSQIKRFGGFYLKALNFGLSTKTRINYSHCCNQFYFISRQ
jgi:hypothetical protein